ncbi:serine/threonine-protein kinase [Actinoplanes italicus]|uniref:non-specific serine/threonine protein kinase n=1 Tax=Actinoplanes italicus TaxID=113567 RepID=A0A2T0JWE0_9ACTN|nr:serine/threonine-protein kinase [Actinoplanes italicus]
MWLSVDEVLRRTVAVKVMLPSVADDPDFARRFEAEATAMARINHPAVASIHDFGRDQGVLYLVMEFVDGESLAQRLSRDGRIAPDETMRLIEQAAIGLQAVHDQGLVHRDIKPANLLVRRNGTVVITDFGIARHEAASRLTVSGAILGTPTYLSPEQVRGEPAGPQSDVYSLGLVAYECLAGDKPFVGDSPYAVALQRLQEGPRTIKVTLPVPVQAAVERALAIDPRDRWPSAAAFAAAVRQVLSGPPSASIAAPAQTPPSLSFSLSPKPGSKRLPVLLAALTALLVIGGGAIAWGVLGDDEPDALLQMPGAAAAQSGGQPGKPGQQWEPELFTTCGDAYCPVEPMCWGGMTANSGVPLPPRRVDCEEPHYWETFRAVPLPAGGVTIDSDAPLIERDDLAESCSEQAMTSRSVEPAKTRRWRRDAWPIPVGADTTLHCIASAPGGESTGGYFRRS